MEPSQRTRNRRPTTPLYDARFEHDACGVGFVADAGGRSRDRVLPLALAGLGALGHRGAFGADGESSDGAGVALPLDRSLLELIAGPELAAGRPGIVSLFLPRGRSAERRARAMVESIFADAGLPVAGWRTVPSDVAALGAAATESRPAFAQAIVARPGRSAEDARPQGDDAFERRLIIARRRLETAARAAGGVLAEIAIPSASARTIVYKGLVIGGRLADLYPDLQAPLRLSYAVFHQRYATNTHPVWRLAQPFRSISHNGEINTVRGNREQVRGRSGDPATSALARELARGRPAAVARRLRLALARRGARAPAGDRLGADAGAADRHPRGTCGAPCPASARGDAPAPDGRVPRAVGRTGGDRLRRRAACRRAGRPQRPAAGGLRRDPRPARRGRVRGRRRPVRGGRDRPARSARAGPAAARRAWPARDPRGRRREAPRPPQAADPRRTPAGPRGSSPRRPSRPDGARYRARPPLPRRARRRARPARHQDDGPRGATSRCGAWATTRRRPVARRLDRPGRRPPPPGVRPGHEPARSTRSASGSSWTCGSSSAGARRCSAARRGPRGPLRLPAPDRGRPRRPAREVAARRRDGPRRSTRRGFAATARPGSTARPRPARRATPSRARRRGADDRADHRPRPGRSIACRSRRSWRRGRPHRAHRRPASAAGPTSSVSAVDILDVHAMAMVLAVGATAVAAAAGDRARGRAGRHAWRRGR